MQSRPPAISFEFFPPKNAVMEERLWDSIVTLAPLKPQFVSVTYGAGGSTRERTHDTLTRILAQTDLTPAAHLTCVGATREEVDAVARRYWEAGIRHIVALRGDEPKDAAPVQGYAYASDLVAGLRKIGDFEISVAAYPEKHPEASSLQQDIDHLKRKVDAGATRAITQFFFNPESYLRFVEAARKRGVEIPIVPGILPIGHFPQAVKFAAMCGTTVPEWMHAIFAGLEEEPQEHEMIATAVAAELCYRLRNAGVETFHFYTLNRAPMAKALCRMLGVVPQASC